MPHRLRDRMKRKRGDDLVNDGCEVSDVPKCALVATMSIDDPFASGHGEDHSRTGDQSGLMYDGAFLPETE